MNANTPNATRRAMLGGLALAIPMTAFTANAMTLPGIGPDRAAWDRALAAYEAADAEYDTYFNGVYRPAERAAEAKIAAEGLPGFRQPGHDPFAYNTRFNQLVSSKISDHVEALIDKCGDADTMLMETPAPDAKALLMKLERLLQGEGVGKSSASYSFEYIEQTVCDMRRILGGEA